MDAIINNNLINELLDHGVAEPNFLITTYRSRINILPLALEENEKEDAQRERAASLIQEGFRAHSTRTCGITYEIAMGDSYDFLVNDPDLNVDIDISREEYIRRAIESCKNR